MGIGGTWRADVGGWPGHGGHQETVVFKTKGIAKLALRFLH